MYSSMKFALAQNRPGNCVCLLTSRTDLLLLATVCGKRGAPTITGVSGVICSSEDRLRFEYTLQK